MNENPVNSLISSVISGDLENVKKLIDAFSLSYAKGWSDGYILLRLAAEYNYSEIIKLLVTKGCKINSRRSLLKPSDSPLHFAIRHSNYEIAEILLDKGANIDISNSYGQTPLKLAVEKGDDVMVHLLLKKHAFSGTDDMYTLLSVAFEKDCKKIVTHLLNYESFMKRFCTSHYLEGITDLHLAVGNGNEKVVKLLLRRGSLVNAKTNHQITSLHIAAEKGYSQIVDYLINHGADINAFCLIYYFHPELNSCSCRKTATSSSDTYHCDGCKFISCFGESPYALVCCTPLHLAVENYHERVVRLLLDNGADVNAVDLYDVTALKIAVEKGNTTISKIILEYCPDKENESNKSCLKIAILKSFQFNRNNQSLNISQNVFEECFSKIAKMLYLYGFTIDPKSGNDDELLYAAVKLGLTKVVSDLLKFGANVNLIINDCSVKGIGWSLLHCAVHCRNFKLVELLISFGADVKYRDKSGKSVLFYAFSNNDIKIADLLLRHGSCVNDNTDVFLNSAKMCHLEMIQLFLQYGGNVNVSDKNGSRALHYIVRSFKYQKSNNVFTLMKTEKLVKFLLRNGADINAKTNKGKTALHLACLCGPPQLVLLLVKYGADINCEYKYKLTCLDLCMLNEEVSWKEIEKMLKQQIVKLKCANLFVSEKNLNSIKDFDFCALEINCIQEVELLKSYKINNVESYYDLLTKFLPEQQLDKYAKNETVEMLFDSETFNEVFVNYGDLLKCFFRRAYLRKYLIENCYFFLYSQGNNLSVLSHDCIEKLLKYLNNNDLNLLLNAFGQNSYDIIIKYDCSF